MNTFVEDNEVVEEQLAKESEKKRTIKTSKDKVEKFSCSCQRHSKFACANTLGLKTLTGCGCPCHK